MNAVIYARYSSDKQTEQSIEGQLRECHAYAKRMGYTVIHEYIDRAISGTSDNRPEFQRMIEDSNKKQFEIIIVWKLDRFARNRYDSAIYKTRLKKNGVKVVSVTEGIGEGNEAIIMEAMLEAMAEVYSRQIGENAARGMRETAMKGLCTGGNIPLGFFIGEDKLLHIDEKKAPIIRYIFKQYADGKTKNQIVEGLNEQRFKTKTNRSFTLNNITFIMQNKMYMGDYTYKGEIERECPAIVSKEIFEKCQNRFEKNKKRRGQKVSENVEYLLSGKLFCGLCGTQMTGDRGTSGNGEKYYYYSCHKRKKYKACLKKSEKKDFIEWYICEQTVEYVLSPFRIEFIAEKVVEQYEKAFSRSKIAEMEAQLVRIDKELDSCVDNLFRATSQMVVDKINERADILGATKAETEIELCKLRIAHEVRITAEEVKKFLNSFCKGDLMDLNFRRRIFDTFINAVYLYDEKVVIYYNIRGGKQVSFIDMLESSQQSVDDIEDCSSSHCAIKGEPTASAYCRGIILCKQKFMGFLICF